jgi:hypothetical protein
LRLDAVGTGLPSVTWLVILVGAIISLTASFFFRVEDARLHGIQVTLLATLIGLVIFMILALDRSSTLDRVDWNAELVRGDLGKAVQQLKRESGKGLLVGGVKLPLALAELGFIDEYELVVHPRLAGHGPTLFAGLSKHVDLRLVSRLEFGSRAVAMRYEPRRQPLGSLGAGGPEPDSSSRHSFTPSCEGPLVTHHF